jgi:hypothetical protein
MSRHSFDPEVAAKVGLNAAVIFQNIVWWAEKNAANNKHFHDGLWWTYNSVSAFADLFPYLTGKQIRTALTKLEDDGLLVSGSFNKSAYDRTKWYAPTCHIGKSDLPKRSNENDQEGKPIPDINTDDKLNKNIRAHEMPNYWRPTNFDPHTKTAHIIAEWTPEEYLTTLEHFEQHHRSKGSKFVDWQSAWGTWVLNSAKYKGKTNGKANRTANSNGSPRDGFAAVLREVGSREDAFPTFDDDGGMRQASPTRLIAPR